MAWRDAAVLQLGGDAPAGYSGLLDIEHSVSCITKAEGAFHAVGLGNRAEIPNRLFKFDMRCRCLRDPKAGRPEAEDKANEL